MYYKISIGFPGRDRHFSISAGDFPRPKAKFATNTIIRKSGKRMKNNIVFTLTIARTSQRKCKILDRNPSSIPLNLFQTKMVSSYQEIPRNLLSETPSELVVE